MLRSGVASLAVALLGVSCQLAPGPPSACVEGLAPDAGANGGSRPDGGPTGGGPSDAGLSDAGPSDAGLADTGSSEGGGPDAGPPEGRADYCASCQSPVVCGGVHNPSIVAVLGIAASAVHPRAYYLHNGPPDVARFFAVDETGVDLGTYDIAGGANLGWQDVAVGPCPAGSCVFLADIGDPGQVRGQYTIYRVTEPAALSAGERSVTAETFPFAYPDGSHDAAAVLVHPVTGIVTVITRDPSGKGALIYELPFAPPGQPVTATPRGSLDQLGLGVSVTGASVRRDGRVLLRTTRGAIFFEAPPGADAGAQPVSAAFRSASCQIATARETDGEAIAWTGSGSGLLTLGRGPAAPLDYVFCASP